MAPGSLMLRHRRPPPHMAPGTVPPSSQQPYLGLSCEVPCCLLLRRTPLLLDAIREPGTSRSIECVSRHWPYPLSQRFKSMHIVSMQSVWQRRLPHTCTRSALMCCAPRAQTATAASPAAAQCLQRLAPARHGGCTGYRTHMAGLLRRGAWRPGSHHATLVSPSTPLTSTRPLSTVSTTKSSCIGRQMPCNSPLTIPGPVHDTQLTSQLMHTAQV